MKRFPVVGLLIATAAVWLIVSGLRQPDPLQDAPGGASGTTRGIARRPPWYPFKFQPKGDVTIPQGNVRMTAEQARLLFSARFESFVAYIMDDPHELAYVKDRLKEFAVYTHTHDPVEIAVSARYCPHSKTVPASTGPSPVKPGKPVITFYMPLWAEYDAWFVESHVRDLFIQVATHELEHAREGFWREDRDHSPQENARTEALAWGITCDRVILPMRLMDRYSGPLETALCDEYVKSGRDTSAPAFQKFISKLSPQER